MARKRKSEPHVDYPGPTANSPLAKSPQPVKVEFLVSPDVWIAAEKTFGKSAMLWLLEPKARFDGKTPLDLSASARGRKRVLDLINLIYHGMYA